MNTRDMSWGHTEPRTPIQHSRTVPTVLVARPGWAGASIVSVCLAITAIMLLPLAFAVPGLTLALAIAAIVTAKSALKTIRTSPVPLSGHVAATIGQYLGYVMAVLGVILTLVWVLTAALLASFHL